MSTNVNALMALFSNDNSGIFGAGTGSGSASGSDSAFNMLLNMVDTSSSTDGTDQDSGLDALLGGSSDAAGLGMGGNFSQLYSMLQDISGTQDSQSSAPGDTSGFSAGALQLMGMGGPLPQFLSAVDSEDNLTPAQQTSLWNISAENLNNPDMTQQSIAAELDQANIPEALPANLQNFLA